MSLCSNYSHKEVQHLAWCLFAPSLIHPDSEPISITAPVTSDLSTWLETLDHNPQPLIDYIQSQNHRLLGSYYECLWQFIASHAPGWEMLAHHFQVHGSQQTLGELDLIARLDQRLMHLELAVKFYLKPQNLSGELTSHWVGPQSHDRLDLKLEKLTKKQLPFLYREETQQALADANLPLPELQRVSIQGYLFTHWQDQEWSLPPSVNPDALVKQWLFAREITQVVCEGDWVVLPKPLWLGPYSPKAEPLPILQPKEVHQHIDDHFLNSRHPYALMLAKLTPGAPHEEYERYFVVHNQWPASDTTHKG